MIDEESKSINDNHNYNKGNNGVIKMSIELIIYIFCALVNGFICGLVCYCCQKNAGYFLFGFLLGEIAIIFTFAISIGDLFENQKTISTQIDNLSKINNVPPNSTKVLNQKELWKKFTNEV